LLWSSLINAAWNTSYHVRVLKSGSNEVRASWLTTRRLRVHAIILAICLWSSFVWIFSNPGLVGRNGVLKGADFLHFYTLGIVAQEHRGADLYNMSAQSSLALEHVPQAGRLLFVPLYGPQVSLLFAPLANFSYPWALLIWELFNVTVYCLCCYAIWRTCANLRGEGATVFVLALAYPAFFHLLAWGQTSAIALACCTLAYLELRAGRLFSAGLTLGCLAFKPQLGLAAAFVLLLSREWRVIGGAVLAGAAQLGAGWLYHGTPVMRDYWEHVVNVRNVMSQLEPRPYQMHGLRSFWAMLVPFPQLAFWLYVITALLVLIAALRGWKSEAQLQVKFGVLLFATVLVSPHVTIYDLTILASAFLLLSDWALAICGPEKRKLALLLYLCYALPLLGPLSHWTHLQLSVLAMVGLIWVLRRVTKSTTVRLPQAAAVI